MNLATQFFAKLPAGDKRVAIREPDGTTITRGELRRQIAKGLLPEGRALRRRTQALSGIR